MCIVKFSVNFYPGNDNNKLTEVCTFSSRGFFSTSASFLLSPYPSIFTILVSVSVASESVSCVLDLFLLGE